MEKNRSEVGGNGCRALRKAIYHLVNSESVITVDNPDDHDPASVLEAAREHLVGRVHAQATKRGWHPDQTTTVVCCLPRLVRFELPAAAMAIERAKRGKSRLYEPGPTQRVKSRAEMPKIPVLISLEPGFRDRLDQALTGTHQLDSFTATSSATQSLA